MTTEQKQLLSKEVKYLSSLTSQNKVATKAGISSATISQMINGNWALIKDEMWQKVMVKLKIELNWNTAQTSNLEYIHKHLAMAKKQSLSFGIADKAGAGKSETYKLFAKTNPNVIYIECMTFWKQKSFAKALVTACGLDDFGTTEDLIEKFIDHVSGLKEPIVILDQLDKLKDTSVDLFIDFFNNLSNCGFVLSGTPALEKRFRRGVNNDKTGYHECWSRLGRKWLKLNSATIDDVTKICQANGIDDIEDIETIFDNCDDDMRRVKRDVQKHFMNKKAA
ncbi:AAA family ATPase [Flavobacterium sp.]|uniref:AAA family ATPase n=1 Tax=Flavobacterium sp. TaxID=239 RepID=UPI003750C81F